MAGGQAGGVTRSGQPDPASLLEEPGNYADTLQQQMNSWGALEKNKSISNDFPISKKIKGRSINNSSVFRENLSKR